MLATFAVIFDGNLLDIAIGEFEELLDLMELSYKRIPSKKLPENLLLYEISAETAIYFSMSFTSKSPLNFM